MQHPLNHHLRRALAAAVLAWGATHGSAALAQAAAYPAKAITFVVPFAAGSATDQLARAIGQSISSDTGQPVVIDNKAGASGMLAAQTVARAPADGQYRAHHQHHAGRQPAPVQKAPV